MRVKETDAKPVLIEIFCDECGGPLEADQTFLSHPPMLRYVCSNKSCDAPVLTSKVHYPRIEFRDKDGRVLL